MMKWVTTLLLVTPGAVLAETELVFQVSVHGDVWFQGF